MARSARIPDRVEVTNEAFRLWREREMRFPAFVRRWTPEALDVASGAWSRTIALARSNLILGGRSA